MGGSPKCWTRSSKASSSYSTLVWCLNKKKEMCWHWWNRPWDTHNNKNKSRKKRNHSWIDEWMLEENCARRRNYIYIPHHHHFFSLFFLYISSTIPATLISINPFACNLVCVCLFVCWCRDLHVILSKSSVSWWPIVFAMYKPSSAQTIQATIRRH